MIFLQPSYLKRGKLFLLRIKQIVHKNKDLFEKSKEQEAQLLIEKLKNEIVKKNQSGIEISIQKLESFLSPLMPHSRFSNIAEHIESIVVAIILALSIQAYFIKPFKIPTGSMQPTLYGMTGHTEEKIPSLLSRTIEFFKNGRSYINKIANQDEEILELHERTFLNFFTFTQIFTTSDTIWIFSPRDVLERDFKITAGRFYHKGQTIIRGFIQAGDQVLVDRISYQFILPRLGDVFVFLTTGIWKIEEHINPSLGSQFYVKRLAGLPGNELSIHPPYLFIDGKKANLLPFLRVMECKNGYRGYSNSTSKGFIFPYLGSPEATFTVPLHSYFALGDNSYNSSDSRFWGILPEKNVIGKGLFVYWPFSNRWGFIK